MGLDVVSEEVQIDDEASRRLPSVTRVFSMFEAIDGLETIADETPAPIPGIGLFSSLCVFCFHHTGSLYRIFTRKLLCLLMFGAIYGVEALRTKRARQYQVLNFCRFVLVFYEFITAVFFVPGCQENNQYS